MAYVPNAAVRQAHAMPHLNTNFQPGTPDFALSIDYILSIVGFPALIAVITALLMICYCFALFCVGCLRCCKCPGFKSKQLNQGDNEFTTKAKKQLKRHKKLMYCFMGLLLSLFITNFFLWLGSHEITVAFGQINSGLDSLRKVFGDISNGANDVITQNSRLSFTMSTACIGLALSGEITTSLDLISSAANGISSSTSDIALLLEDAKIGNDIDKQKDIIVGIYFAVIFFLGTIFSFALYFHNKLLFRFSILLTWLVTFTLFIIASLEILILMLVGDFCMDPTGTILKLIKSGVIEFYLTCKGVNPLKANLDNINLYSDIIQTTLNALLDVAGPLGPVTCKPATDPIFVDLKASTASMTKPIGDCDGVYGAYKSFVLDATCTSGFQGVYNVWAVQFALAAILYVTMIFANAVYQSYVYADGSKIHPLTEKDIENMDASHQPAMAEMVTPHNDHDKSPQEEGMAIEVVASTEI